MDPAYRADVVGSLLRPEALRRARAGLTAGTVSREQLTAAEDDAVRQVIDLQRDCGLPVVTDGELRRGTYTAPLTEGLEGVAEVGGRYRTWHDARGEEHRLRQPHAVTDKLKLRESVAVNEYRFARAVTGLPVKVTLPSPLTMLNRWTPEVSGTAYPDPFELFADCTEILGSVVSGLIGLGCRYIQFDAPDLTNVVDAQARRELDELGISPAQYVDTGCRLLNQLASAGRGDVRFAVHLCRGNRNGLFRKSGGYERVMSAIFENTPNIATLMLEFDDERSGGFEPLRGAPAGKTLVLGLVSTKTARLEEPDEIARRIEQAARYVPLGQLALSTQCGFSSTTEGSALNSDEQRRKLALVADVAARVWQ
ncbi:MAG TPA: cobalamin-independent methionine synthase II family protein [Trebonia sp.]|jgi:5-methyltetrahydropteroyltriglutamate--homocysteine methyltransferase|nr:cobalamin-independent methionine synthase II family protein [Trebonia sp.]